MDNPHLGLHGKNFALIHKLNDIKSDCSFETNGNVLEKWPVDCNICPKTLSLLRKRSVKQEILKFIT